MLRRPKKTLSIEENFKLPWINKDTNEADSPLQMHGRSSKFIITVIDKTGEKVFHPTATLSPAQIYSIRVKAEAYIAKAILEVPSDNIPKAYTMKIPVSTKYRGKSPASVLLKDPEAIKDLAVIKQHLQHSMERNAGGSGIQSQCKKIIHAIDEGIDLYGKGSIDRFTADRFDSKRFFCIVEKPVPYLMSGSKMLAFSMMIEYIPLFNKPFRLSIFNAYYYYRKEDNGHIILNQRSKSMVSESYFDLTEDEFLEMINHMQAVLQDFQTINFRKQYMLSEELSQTRRSTVEQEKTVA